MNAQADEKEFYDPHPGVGGAAVPLPLPLKVVADGLSGKRMTLGLALEIVRAIAPNAEIRADEKYHCVFLSLHFGNGGQHMWRLVRYR